MLMKKLDKHFTATVFVVNRGRVLLVKHKKLRMWLPPGGHIEKNELPEEAAAREVKEEVGLITEFISKKDTEGDTSLCKALFTPACILLEDIRYKPTELKHLHIDLIYFAKVKGLAKIKQHDSWTAAKWWGAADLKTKEIVPSVRHWALRAIKAVS